MNEKALKILEYEKIIQKLTDLAGSAPGKALCRSLAPSTDLSDILRMQRETAMESACFCEKAACPFPGSPI